MRIYLEVTAVADEFWWQLGRTQPVIIIPPQEDYHSTKSKARRKGAREF